jgi:VCBS repeat-containing protein
MDDNYSINEDSTLVVPPNFAGLAGVLGNDDDPDFDSLTASLDEDVSSGALNFNSNGNFDYIPALNFNGIVTFTYIASDGVLTDTAMVTITVFAVNDAPIGVNDVYGATEGMTLTISAPTGVLSNDIDVDNVTLTATLNTNVMSGTLMLNADGSFDYMPDAGFCGMDSFTYDVTDGDLSDTATVDITVASAGSAQAITVTVSVTNTTDVLLLWLDDGANSGGYAIYRSESPYVLGSLVDTVPAGSTSYIAMTDIGNPATNYYYTVQALNCDASSTASSNDVAEFDFAIVPGTP